VRLSLAKFLYLIKGGNAMNILRFHSAMTLVTATLNIMPLSITTLGITIMPFSKVIKMQQGE
jgi:hypothetical protein